MAATFGLGRVEGKQVVAGDSGAEWQIDAKGVRDGDDAIVIIECRRFVSHRVTQEQMGAVAYRIHDTRAAGGILVSPLPPQRGAQLVAGSARIACVQLSPESTTTEYVLRFLNQTFIGVAPAVPNVADLPPIAEIVPPPAGPTED